MKQYKLKNGLTIIHYPRKTESVAIQINIRVGSNQESKDISGISHFIEHMLFEGTKKRRSSRDIANEVEKWGAELNAYTSDERTTYHIKIIKKHFDKALDVLSDIVQNPLFRKQEIDKERKVILDEIKLVTDEPRHHQWIVFEKTLFKKHPVRNPVYGTVKAVKAIGKKELLDYYKKYYVPNNMIITVVGDVKNLKEKIHKAFSNFKPKKLPEKKIFSEPSQTEIQKCIETRDVANSYVVLGYKTIPRKEKESYTLDVIRSILGRGQSGRMFYEIRTKRGLAYEVGVHHEPATDYGFIAMHLGTNKKNINKCVKIIQEELQSIKNIDSTELQEAKDYIEGNFYLNNEDNYQFADNIGYWALMGDYKLIDSYIEKIKKVTIQDIKKAVDKYFTKNYTLAVIKQK